MLGGQLLFGRGHGLGVDFGAGGAVAVGAASKIERTVACTSRIDALPRTSGNVGGWIITDRIVRESTWAASAARFATSFWSIVVQRLSRATASSFGTFGSSAIG